MKDRLPENGRPTSEFDSPKRGEPRFPLGVPRFTMLKALRTEMPKVR
jgi:hypothetical protein